MNAMPLALLFIFSQIAFSSEVLPSNELRERVLENDFHQYLRATYAVSALDVEPNSNDKSIYTTTVMVDITSIAEDRIILKVPFRYILSATTNLEAEKVIIRNYTMLRSSADKGDSSEALSLAPGESISFIFEFGGFSASVEESEIFATKGLVLIADGVDNSPPVLMLAGYVPKGKVDRVIDNREANILTTEP